MQAMRKHCMFRSSRSGSSWPKKFAGATKAVQGVGDVSALLPCGRLEIVSERVPDPSRDLRLLHFGINPDFAPPSCGIRLRGTQKPTSRFVKTGMILDPRQNRGSLRQLPIPEIALSEVNQGPWKVRRLDLFHDLHRATEQLFPAFSADCHQSASKRVENLHAHEGCHEQRVGFQFIQPRAKQTMNFMKPMRSK